MKFSQHAMSLPWWSRRRTSGSGGERQGPGPSASDTSPSRRPGRRSDPEEDLPAPATSGPTRNAS
jgi:hypothetical protein